MDTENISTTTNGSSESVSTDTSDIETSALSHDESGNPGGSESPEGDLGGLSDEEGSDGSQGKKDSGDQNKPKKKGGFERRIERFQRQMSEKDQRIAALEAQLTGKTPAPEERTAQKHSDMTKPNREDFETIADYTEAYADWKIEQANADAQRKADEAKANESASARAVEYKGKVDEFVKRTHDFHDVVADFQEEHGNFNATPRIWQALHDSDFGEQIPYEIMKTPGEYERLSKMSEDRIIFEIGKMSARIHTKNESAKKNLGQPSKAPAPVSPLGKGSTPVTKSLSDPNISFADYEKIRMQQLKNKK